jgi:hypothetical protein
MKKEMIKFVSDNFEVIKNNFYNSEIEILEEMGEDEGEDMSDDIEFLTDQMNVLIAEELINVINERSIAIDLDNEDELSELFDDIKVIFSGIK